jgi:hypothetical protein
MPSRSFVRSGRSEDAAREAEPRDEEEARQMEQAEAVGKAHAKDEDPTVPGANATHDKRVAAPAEHAPHPTQKARPEGRAFLPGGVSVAVIQWKKK